VVQQVVEVGHVRQRDAVRLQRSLNASGAGPVERTPEIERVGHRIEHRLWRHIRLARMKRGRQLQLVRAKLRGKRDPILDSAIRIGIAHLSRRELLKRSRENAHLHELGLEGPDRHQRGWALSSGSRPFLNPGSIAARSAR
jgi:hypothetical protein